MLRRFYAGVMRLAASRHAPLSLFGIAFAESSFFPVPPDVMLIPMVLARPERTWVFAGICTAGSITGGVFGYGIGYFLAPVGRWLLSLLGDAKLAALFQSWFAKYGVWVILGQGMLPIPYKLVTITAGLAHLALPVFIGASILTRTTRFFVVAATVRRYGPTLLPMIERRLAFVAAGIVILAGAVLLALHLLR